jgi:benzoate membrane transport protein
MAKTETQGNGPWQWLSPLAAGFVAVLVGFTSSAVIVYQAAAAAGANAAQTTSWMMALCLGMAVTSLGLSWHYRVPVLTAWSTPGAAVLASSLVGVPMAEAIGAFVVCGALITLVGVTGWFERIMNRIPLAIASAMLAGVLFRFGVDLFGSMGTQLPLVLAMFVGYFFFKRWQPRYAIPLVLMLGIGMACWLGLLNLQTVNWSLAQPVWQTPEFSLRASLSVALPLFLVTMASQNMPGIATLKASGYGATPISPLIAWTGVATLVLAPFGAFALNLAAITAAICMGPQAHEDPRKRYFAAMAAGGFYFLTALAAGSVAALLAAFPVELVKALAGLALLGTIANAVHVAMANDQQREAALVTFLCAASGLTIGGVGSAFWGLVAGGLVMLLSVRRKSP